MDRKTFNMLIFGIALLVFIFVPGVLILFGQYNFFIVHTLSFLVSLALPILIIVWGDRYEKIYSWIAGLMIITDLVIYLGYLSQTMSNVTITIVPLLSIVLVVLGVIFRSQFYYAPRAGIFIAIVYGISLIRYSLIFGLFAVVIQEGVPNSLLILSIIELMIGFLITVFKLLVLDALFEEKFAHIK